MRTPLSVPCILQGNPPGSLPSGHTMLKVLLSSGGTPFPWWYHCSVYNPEWDNLPLMVPSHTQTVEQVSLQIQEEGECWREAGTEPVRRGITYRWRVSSLAPCKHYTFRLVLTPSFSSCSHYLQQPITSWAGLWSKTRMHRVCTLRPLPLVLD